jgi:hypothetical protein
MDMTFEELIGIQEVQQREPSPLEKIFQLEKEALQQERPAVHWDKINEATYENFFALTENLELNSTTLQLYIFSRLNDIFWEDQQDMNYLCTRGIYSGALLHRFALQNPGETLIIDGQGKRFSYLFSHARKTPHTIIQDLNGLLICSYVQNAQMTFIAMYEDIAAQSRNSTFVQLSVSGDIWQAGADTTTLAYGLCYWKQWHKGPGKALLYAKNGIYICPERKTRKYTAEDREMREVMRKCMDEPLEYSERLHAYARSMK